MLATAPQQHGTVCFAINPDHGTNPQQSRLLHKFFNGHGNGIGYFVASQPEYLFPNHFCSQKANAAIGDVVFSKPGLAFGQVRFDDVRQTFGIFELFCAQWHDFSELELLCHALQIGE